MQDKLNEIYQQMITESNDSMTVGKTKAGELEGAEKAKPIAKVATADNQVDTPKEGPSQEEVKKGGATANSTAKKEAIKDSVDHKTSRFNSLYKSVIGEDFGTSSDDIVNAPEVESDEFDEEMGDFSTEEDSMDEETDIATELRTMAERLIELADKFTEDEGGEDFGDELEGLEDDTDELGGESEFQESMKSQPEPKKAKGTTLGPKMSKTVKGKLASVGKKSAKTNSMKKHDGTPQKLGEKGVKTNQSGMTAKGSGPASSKKSTDMFSK